MKIGELSELTNASIRSIRHYEERDLLSSQRLGNGFRYFDDSAIERIETIQLYLKLGFTTAQIKEIVTCMELEPDIEIDDCEETLQIYEEKLAAIKQQMNALVPMKERLEQRIKNIKAKREKQHN